MSKNFLIVALCFCVIALGYFTAPMISGLIKGIFNAKEKAIAVNSGSSADIDNNEDIVDLTFRNGVYIPINQLTTPEGLTNVIQMCESNKFDAVVIEIKGDSGILCYKSEMPIATAIGSGGETGIDLKKVAARFKENNIYTIAKIVCFKDNFAPESDAELSVPYIGGGRWWNEYKWLNPYIKRSREYLSEISEEIIKSGFDEVMLDEVKFPDSGRLDILGFGDDEVQTPKPQMLTEFINEVCETVHNAGGKLSLCIPASGIYTDEVNIYSGQKFNFNDLKIDYLSSYFQPSVLKITHKQCDIPSDLFYQADDNLLPLFDAVLSKAVNRLTRENDKITLRPFIQDYNTPSRPLLPEDIKAQIESCRVYGSAGYITFNEYGVYTLLYDENK